MIPVHGSIMYADITKINNLWEEIRQYVVATGMLPDIFPKRENDDEPAESGIAFGEYTTADAKKDKAAKKKAKKHQRASPALQASFAGKDPRLHGKELAASKERAMLALQAASKLAGEEVVFCCGSVRIKSKRDWKCDCDEWKKELYKEYEEWQAPQRQ